MDAEDHGRVAKHLARLLAALQIHGVLTNHQVREIAGSRGMARATELKNMGHPISTRKLAGSVWEVRYDKAALGRSAETPVAYPDADCGPLFRNPEELGAYRG
jgi:hypothetical protein